MTSASRRVATIDIGTNSVLLLIAESTPTGLVPVIELATITRLGQGVDRARRLAPEAVERTLECLAHYARVISSNGPMQTIAVGTSAMRDAQGGAEFRERAAAILGVAPRVASGDEEAELTFFGSLSGLPQTNEVLVFDVGGGSTELIVGAHQSGPRHKISLDIGSVRLTERHVRSDPPLSSELVRIREDVRRSLDSVPFEIATEQVVGVAGTVTTIFAYVRNVAPYDASRVHGMSLCTDEVAAAADRLAALTTAERKAIAAIDPKRADVIVAGTVLVDELLKRAKAHSMTVSDRGVRWGLAARAFQ
ncbi:MAG: Ppx/GppA family phosphatase [Polyangiaceae bacterium]|nr:Ppx/GppA family phosphatase [Polyangiaceae bacterium]